MYVTTTGLVLREVDYRETSRVLTVLTMGQGKLTVSARGARRKGSKTAAATQFLALSEMTLLQSHGRWTLTEGRCIEEFAGLRDDPALLALGAYIAEVAETAANEDEPNPELMSLVLNALFAAGEQKRPPELVRAVFELRAAALSGFVPDLSACSVCGKTEPEEPMLDVTGGTVHCRACGRSGQYDTFPLTPDTLKAMRFCLESPSKRAFSFSLMGQSLRRFSAAAESYLAHHFDVRFKSLSYYKSVRDLNELQ